MLRVNNLEESINFYTQVLGMKLLSKTDYPEGKFTLAFLSFGETKQDPCIELTYNWDRNSYTLGDAYGHVAFSVNDIYSACDKIKKAGGKVIREPGPMKHGTTVLAFIEDPNGYKIELIENKNS